MSVSLTVCLSVCLTVCVCLSVRVSVSGFYGVLFMASYPNIAFDLCGICCGHFLMPFWTFFLATFIGKAVIRNSYQSILYVVLCR